MAVPTPPVPKGLSAGATKYLKQNWKFAYAGGIGLAFLGLDVAGIATADNKFKALLKTFKDFVLIRVAMVGLFTAVATAVKSLVRDTGSLNEALKKLTQIQQYSRQFQAFTGGLNSAKQRVAELYQLSLRKPFKFEDIVEANKSLEVFTRGAYTSVEATKTIGEAALASGNTIGDTARAVGNFYDQLRSGKPVGEAAEQLRQMGLISGSTAQELTGMSESGSALTATFSELTGALEKTAQGAAGYKDELEGITSEHEKAVSALKASFGAPFTAADSQNTKNMTAALQGITPVVGKLAGLFALVYNGLSTAGSALAKFAGQSKVVQAVLLVLGQAVVAVTVACVLFGSFAAATLIPVLLRFAGVAGDTLYVALTRLNVGFVAATRAAQALEVAIASFSIIGVLLLVAGAVASLVGAVIHAQDEAKQAEKDFQSWSSALKETTAAILEQAAAVTTLAQKYEALGKTLQQLSANQKQLKTLRQEDRKLDKQLIDARKGDENLDKLGLGGITRRFRTRPIERKKEINEAKQAELERQQKVLQQSKEEQAARDVVHEQFVKQEAERRFLVEQQGKGAQKRDEEARAGLKVAADVENRRSKITANRLELEQKLRDEQAKTKVEPEDMVAHQRKILGLQDDITEAKKQEQQIGLDAPEFSATQKSARAEQLQQAKKAVELEAQLKGLKGGTTEERALIESRLKEAQAIAGTKAIEEYRAHPEALSRAEIEAQIAQKREAAAPAPAEVREARVTELTTRAETKANELRRHGDIAQSQALGDILSFTKSFESLRGSLGDQKAASVSLAKTQEDIAQEYVPASQITSSLAAVGGGGEVSKVDPELDSARRREAIQAEMLSVLKILAGQQPEEPAQPVYSK